VSPTEPDATSQTAGDRELIPSIDGAAAGDGHIPDPGPPARNGGREGAGGRKRRWLFEAAIVVVVALVVAVLLRTFVVQTFFIPSGSMLPTLQVGDRILVNKLSYHLHGVGRGDIVVFARPPKEEQACAGPLVNDLVKRVIGLPGETVSLRNGRVAIDGKVIKEPWLPHLGAITFPGPGASPYSLSKPFKVPAGDYFLLGDNRESSCDSRYWGPIPRSLIVGKVVFRIWPLTRLAFF
jgi:signal peptidase I